MRRLRHGSQDHLREGIEDREEEKIYLTGLRMEQPIVAAVFSEALGLHSCPSVCIPGQIAQPSGNGGSIFAHESTRICTNGRGGFGLSVQSAKSAVKRSGDWMAAFTAGADGAASI